MNIIRLRKMLASFYEEDIGERDVTSETIFPIEERGTGVFIAKENGVFSGEQIIRTAYSLFSNDIHVTLHKHDGDIIKKKDTIATVEGPMQYLLTAERVILNLIQRMSGIATMTKRAVEALGESKTKICDTRKTTPGLRMLEKYAVTCGGGVNHRFGLYDGVMIKDNHIEFAGSITKAVDTVKQKLGHMIKVEVEIETEKELEEAISSKADIIMFDNCTPEQATYFQTKVPNEITTELSGGISITTLPDYKNTGVGYISIGALTHSVKALDISFNVKGGKKDE
ncbi:MAG TPA: carboxylating nicotinate-nucleotide diphosphorylase [Massilibacterium sp.]|nr:carboxylating nicotinate-nucleotide diphosphorylase [Massilibacterium sp.]